MHSSDLRIGNMSDDAVRDVKSNGMYRTKGETRNTIILPPLSYIFPRCQSCTEIASSALRSIIGTGSFNNNDISHRNSVKDDHEIRDNNGRSFYEYFSTLR